MEKTFVVLMLAGLILAGCVGQTQPATNSSNSTNNTEVTVMAEKTVKNGDTV